MPINENTPTSINLKLETIPIELQLNIISDLTFLEKQLLRGTNQHMRAIIPAPTAADFHKAEDDRDIRKNDLFYCNSCSRFRHRKEFSVKMVRTNNRANKGGRYSRWCIDCGSQPLIGGGYHKHRYLPGNTWRTVEGDTYLRCPKCLQCAPVPDDLSTFPDIPIYYFAKICGDCLPRIKQEIESARRRKEEHMRAYEKWRHRWCQEQEKNKKKIAAENVAQGDLTGLQGWTILQRYSMGQGRSLQP